MLLEYPMSRIQAIFDSYGMRERYDWLLKYALDTYRAVQAAERQAVIEQYEAVFTARLKADEENIKLLGAVAHTLQQTQVITQFTDPKQPKRR